MSVLKKFFEMAVLLTFILFCINGMLFLFGDTFVPGAEIPLATLTGDTNTFSDTDTNSSYILQASSIGTRPIDFEYLGNAIATLAFGFEIKLTAILGGYEGLGGIALFISSILVVIRVVGIIYLILAAIGTPLGGSVP